MDKKITFGYYALLLVLLAMFIFSLVSTINACSPTNPMKGYSRYVTDTKNITVENIDPGNTDRCFVRQYSLIGTQWVLKHQVACDGPDTDMVVGHMIETLNN